MKRIKRFAAAVLLSFGVLFSGCSGAFFGPGLGLEELLSPPKLSGDQAQIYEAMVNSIGGNFTLKYPRSGDYRSAFLIRNIDDDPEDEAIVFYKQASSDPALSGVPGGEISFNFLDRDEDGRWQSAAVVSFTAVDIERVSFTRLGYRPGINIIAGYSISATEKRFSVLRYEDGNITTLADEPYAYIFSGQFFPEPPDTSDNPDNPKNAGDKENLILTIKTELLNPGMETEARVASAEVYSQDDDGNVFLKGSVAVAADTAEYIQPTTGRIMLNREYDAVFLNYRRADSDFYGTDVLYWAGGVLRNPIAEIKANQTRIFRRANMATELAMPADIDGDGFVEIPALGTEFKGYEEYEPANRLYPVIWRKFRSNGELYDYASSYFSAENRFAFLFPERWRGLVTARVSGGEVTFAMNAGRIENAHTELLSIKSVRAGEAVPPEKDGWQYYADSVSRKIHYYIKKSSGTALAPTATEITGGVKVF
ncbi:hypothetical protein FACS189499_00330 [Clostridia bacterium]|nr:hypothetical protein FACS189499_00330 [Clostridia bacterium]